MLFMQLQCFVELHATKLVRTTAAACISGAIAGDCSTSAVATLIGMYTVSEAVKLV